MEIKLKSEFNSSDKEYLHQQMQEVSEFFAGVGVASITKTISHKGRVKIKLTITNEGTSLKFSASGNTVIDCLNKMKKEWNQVFTQLTDEVVSNAQRVSEVNQVLKDSKIH